MHSLHHHFRTALFVAGCLLGLATGRAADVPDPEKPPAPPATAPFCLARVDVAEAVEKASTDDPMPLVQIIRAVIKTPPADLSPEDYALALELLLDSRKSAVEYFAITLLEPRLKKDDLSNIEAYLLIACRRVASKELPKFDEVHTVLAAQAAIKLLEKNTYKFSSTSLNVLSTTLYHDIPHPVAGGIGHNAMAQMGEAGFNLLRHTSRNADEVQLGYIRAAVVRFTEVNLVPAMGEACADTSLDVIFRCACLTAIGTLINQSPLALDIVEKACGDDDVRISAQAVYILAKDPTPATTAKLEKQYKNIANHTLVDPIQRLLLETLVQLKPDNYVPILCKHILAPETTDKEKRYWSQRLDTVPDSYWTANEAQLAKLLRTNTPAGVPMNVVRVAVWRKLYLTIKKKYGVELLMGQSPESFTYETQEITRDIQLHEPSLDAAAETRRFVRAWVPPPNFVPNQRPTTKEPAP